MSTEPRQARREDEHSPFSEKGLVSSCSLCLSYRVENRQLRRVLVIAPRGGHRGARGLAQASHAPQAGPQELPTPARGTREGH